MSWRCLVALLLVSLLLPALGCRHADSAPEMNVTLTVEPDPPKVGQARLTLTVKDEAGSPVEGATLKLEGNMAHAGMKPVFADATEETGGLYRANLEFTMAGDWFILIDGKLSDGRSFRKKIDVKGVKAE
jgi:hypothetical protein